jgi:hypothetical protein
VGIQVRKNDIKVLEEGSTLEKMAAHYKIKEIEKDK